MRNIPNPELWSKFVDAVKAGRIEGLTTGLVSRGAKLHPTITNLEHLSVYVLRVNDTWEEFTPGQSYDALCSELRRWIAWRNLEIQLNSNALHVFSGNGTTGFLLEWDSRPGEIDCHLSAALRVIEKEGEEKPQLTAAEWNAKYPIGTRVRYWPFEREGEGRESSTRSEAWELGSGHPVVSVNGYRGGIHLTHVEPIAEEGEPE